MYKAEDVMITLKNVRNLDGEISDLQIASTQNQTLEANGLLLLPGLVDSHISLGSPSQESWASAIKSIVKGGITTILDIPSPDWPDESLEEKRGLIDQRLADLQIPLTYELYGGSKETEAMGLQKKLMMGSVIFFNPELNEKEWNRLFQMAAWENLPIVVNAKNENARSPNSKESFLEKAISYAEKQNTRLYVLNIATQDELDLIKKGQAKSLLIYTETTPQHLAQADFLWEAINRGEIEVIGSGYQLENDQGKEMDLSHPSCLLPFLLTAHLKGKITLERLVHLTRMNVYEIFEMETWKREDFVLVDLEKEQVCSGVKLKGWPVYTIIKGQIFK